eukprot:1146695-Pelagomonas_calceolata.AAC.4
MPHSPAWALQASKPFLCLDLKLPPRHVDVNTHPTKREVGFIHQAQMRALRHGSLSLSCKLTSASPRPSSMRSSSM